MNNSGKNIHARVAKRYRVLVLLFGVLFFIGFILEMFFKVLAATTAAATSSATAATTTPATTAATAAATATAGAAAISLAFLFRIVRIGAGASEHTGEEDHDRNPAESGEECTLTAREQKQEE